MESLCKTCCNGACPLRVTKNRLILSCIEYIPGMMIGERVDSYSQLMSNEYCPHCGAKMKDGDAE